MKRGRCLSAGDKWVCRLNWFFAAFCLLTISNVGATTYYVATTGNNSAAGTMAQPFATLQKGNDVAVAGDTVYIRGGTYSITTPSNSGAGITITKSGTSDTKRIYFWAYPGEVPVFDFSKMTISGSGYTHGFMVTGSWLHFKGIEEKGVPMNSSSNCGMHVDNCSNNTFELMNFHNNCGTGIFFSHGTGGHLLLNCDSHDNYDPTPGGGDGPGENADGFGVHYQESGTSTIIRGCRSWWNSDDGYDFISQEWPVTIENSYAYGSGYINSGSGTAGNGNGFKIGSSKTGIRHIVRNNVAWGCRASGFYANHSGGGNTWYNNTAYKNSTQFNMLASTWSGTTRTGDDVKLTGAKAHILRNNIGFPNKNTDMGTDFGTDDQFNTWNLNITPADKDFGSVTAPGVGSGLLGPRQANGNPPSTNFLKLASGSAMIDKGTNVGLPFTGSAPDLGAYEYGSVTQTQARPQTVINPVKNAVHLTLLGFARSGKPGMEISRTGLYSITGQRIHPNGTGNASVGLRPGVYIEKRLIEE
jgi:hypothetical protein